MKKSFLILAFLATVAGFISCTKDNASEITDAGNNGTIVYASTADATKTILADDFRVVWSEGDKIKFVKDGDEDVTHIFTLASGSGSTSGTFLCQDVVLDGTYTVYYPASYDGTNWPKQIYVSPTDISNVPMKATATVTGGSVSAISFTNEGGILHYTLKKGESWWNQLIKINIWSDTPALDVELDCLCLDPLGGVEITKEGTVFNIAVPEGEYHDVTLEFEDFSGSGTVMKASTLEVTRNMVSRATFEINPIEKKQPIFSSVERSQFLEGENIEMRVRLYIVDSKYAHIPLTGKEIQIKLNGEIYYGRTDEEGIASISIGVLPPKKYYVVAFYRGNIYFNKADLEFTIDVN